MSKKVTNAAMPFVWFPGQGIDEAASQRLCSRGRPTLPMGEAWFMGGERAMFTELLDCEASELPRIDHYLSVILSGTKIFGTLDFAPRREWESWFRYFLAHFNAPNNFDGDSTFISGLMIFYPEADKLRKYEPQTLHDILATVGRVILEPKFWTKGEINITHEAEKIGSRYLFCDYQNTNDLFSASMFLCWKYLRPEQIETWFQSVLDIESAGWRAQVMVWLLGAHSFLNGAITQPAQLKKRKPDITWTYSDYLDGFYEGYPHADEAAPFLKPENIVAMQSAIEKLVTPALFFQWLDSFAQHDYLRYQVLGVSEQFFETFFQ